MFLIRYRAIASFRSGARRGLLAGLAVFAALGVIGCSNGDLERKKLEVILADDLAAIVEGVAAEGLLESPYFTLISYDRVPGDRYTIKAVAEFRFLKTVPRKVVRKYRYHHMIGMWERYYNKYHPENGSDSTAQEMPDDAGS